LATCDTATGLCKLPYDGMTIPSDCSDKGDLDGDGIPNCVDPTTGLGGGKGNEKIPVFDPNSPGTGDGGSVTVRESACVS
jgi:hypothetical protein